jgi:NhaC family Na+:H+ antiporter
LQKKQVKFKDALVTVIILTLIMFYAITVCKTNPHIPMLLGCAVASVISIKNGYRWVEIEEGMTNGIVQSLKSIIILMLIGILIGIWIEAGIVPTIIYYGLKIVSPRFFLTTVMIVCSIISMAVGSWGTAGTVGVAFMGMSQAMGVPLNITAGAVISGAYFGDKISPLSDSTNLASAVTGVDIFKNVSYMFPVAGLVYLIAGITYTVISWRFADNYKALTGIENIVGGLESNFNISPVLLVPLVIVALCIIRKVPSIPSITIGIIMAVLIALFFQETDIQRIFSVAYYGYIGQTGDNVLDRLLTVGGLEKMMFTVSMIIAAMMFGGIMESTGQVKVLMTQILRRVTNSGVFVCLTVFTCIIINMILPEQYIAISIPGKMYAKEYEKRRIDLRELTRALGAGGATTSPLVAWNTCGLFMSSVLGVSAYLYAPYAILNLVTPVLVIMVGFVKQR